MHDRREGAPPSRAVPAGAGLAEGPFLIDGCDTLVKLFLLRCRTLGERTAHREKELGIWRSHSWAAFLDAARAIGLGLAELGLKRGDVVSILSEDNKEWIYADIGVQCVGGIVSGVYTTDSPDQVAYLLDDSGSRFLVVENDEQLDKFLEIRDRVPEVVKCVVLHRDGLDDFSDDQVLFLDELSEIGRRVHARDPERFGREVEASRPEDIAGTVVYMASRAGDYLMGVTLADLARQVREAFYGAEVQRIQRDSHEIRVMVRYPRSERRSSWYLKKRVPANWSTSGGWSANSAGSLERFESAVAIRESRWLATRVG